MKRLFAIVALIAIVALALAAVVGCQSNNSAAQPVSGAGAEPNPGPVSPSGDVLPEQAQQAQAQQDKARILSSPGWQPIQALAAEPDGGMDGQDWVGVKCSSEPPDTPPNAAVGGNLTLTIWNPGPDDQTMLINEVNFPGGGQSPVNPEDIQNVTVAAGVVDVIHTSYISMVGNWAPGCWVSIVNGP